MGKADTPLIKGYNPSNASCPWIIALTANGMSYRILPHIDVMLHYFNVLNNVSWRPLLLTLSSPSPSPFPFVLLLFYALLFSVRV
jgi:hypothetical protein